MDKGKKSDKNRVQWITQTALFIALLVSFQAVTRPLVQLPLGQLVTGSCVNFLLISSCILVGLPSALAVASVSPVFAYLIIGVPAFPLLIPFIIAGNMILVTAVGIIAGKSFVTLTVRSYIRMCAAMVAGAALKFLVLWVGVVHIALALIPDIKPAQVDAMSFMFSWPQLVTAAIGSTLAIAIVPRLVKILKTAERD